MANWFVPCQNCSALVEGGDAVKIGPQRWLCPECAAGEEAGCAVTLIAFLAIAVALGALAYYALTVRP